MSLCMMHAITVIFMIVDKKAYFLLAPLLYFVDCKLNRRVYSRLGFDTNLSYF